MTRKQDSPKEQAWKEALTKVVKEENFLRPLVEQIVQQILEAEMDETLGAEKSERTLTRVGYRSGYYGRTLVTRVGKLELRVPQDRQGRFRTEVFERYQRSEKALVGALAEMYVQGVSTRKVKEITEQLCGHEFSASTVSRINQGLDEDLGKFADRKLEEKYPYLILDARYEKVREDGVIRSQAVQVAIGINQDGRRCVLGVELANRESTTSWRDFLTKLKQWWKCSRRPLGNVAMFTSCATRWIICPAKPTMTAWLNCDGFTTAMILNRRGKTWQPGW
jgi:putative transposase